MKRVVSVSREELEGRRKAILERVGVTYEEFEARAEASALVGEEWEAWQELRDIRFLLGDV